MTQVVIAEQARVALGDEIGEALGAQLTVMLIGERPGLVCGRFAWCLHHMGAAHRPHKRGAQLHLKHSERRGCLRRHAAQRIAFFAKEARLLGFDRDSAERSGRATSARLVSLQRGA